MLHLLIKPLYLHPKQRKKNGRVAQLNRVADYGSAGYRFESCRGHFSPSIVSGFCDGRVAQLNRVADYGSAGYRFESCRGHTVSEGIHSKGSLFQYIRTDDAIRRKRDSRHYAMC